MARTTRCNSRYVDPFVGEVDFVVAHGDIFNRGFPICQSPYVYLPVYRVILDVHSFQSSLVS